MLELDAFLDELLQTIRASRGAIEAELELHVAKNPIDREPVERLRASVLEFAQQAEVLVNMMDQRGADEALVMEAKDLTIFFQGARYGLEFIVKASLG